MDAVTIDGGARGGAYVGMGGECEVILRREIDPRGKRTIAKSHGCFGGRRAQQAFGIGKAAVGNARVEPAGKSPGLRSEIPTRAENKITRASREGIRRTEFELIRRYHGCAIV